MHNFTYRMLLEKLKKLTPKQLDATATVELAVENECFAVQELRISGEDHDSLDEDHPILWVNEAGEEN